jgi:spermidine/putrescine transport system permease protein
MVYNYLPFMVLPIYTVMSKLDKRVIEASRDLGANPFQTLTRVILPLTLSGIVSGVTMVFVPSISTFYVSKAMSNGKVYLIGDLIETEFLSLLNYNMGSALSLILMILILVSMFVMDRFGDDEEGSVLV